MELTCFSGTLFSNIFHNTGDLYGVNLFLGYSLFKFLDNKSTPLALFTFKGSFLAVLVQKNNSLNTIWFETVSCLLLKFSQFWNRFGCVLHNTVLLYGISLFLGYCYFKFLDNKVIPLALFTFRRRFLAVLAQRNYSLYKI